MFVPRIAGASGGNDRSACAKPHPPPPSSRHDLTLTARRFSVGDDTNLSPRKLKPGELDSLLVSYGGALRLRDGSLRLGDRGTITVFEDTESIAGKLESLMENRFARTVGVHIMYDVYGVAPDPGRFRLIAVKPGYAP